MNSPRRISTLACALVLLGCIAASDWNSGKQYASGRMVHSRQSDDPLSDRAPFEGQDFRLGLERELEVVRLLTPPRAGFRPKNSPEAERFLEELVSRPGALPARVDWREMGRVTAVKDQGHCASCWAFVVVGSLEAQAVARNISSRLTELSAQNLVDCADENRGCAGGSMLRALDYVARQGALDRERAYRYRQMTGKCRAQTREALSLPVLGSFMVREGDEQQLKSVLARFGPVGAAIDAKGSLFRNYRSGVYYDKDCLHRVPELNHHVLVVGYGTDQQQGDYWILKNSWGESWGQGGYMLMARNRDNHCGIASVATGPLF